MTDLLSMVKNVNGRYSGDMIFYFQKVMQAPNANAPYHNVRHMLHVFWEVYDGCLEMGIDPDEMRLLLFAALFHDYGHKGIKVDDQVNIDTALQAVDIHALPQDRPHLKFVRDAIRCTMFPYTDEVFTQSQLLLRDTDQSQTFSNVWIQSILYNLGTELEMSYEQMLRMQKPFLEKLKFSTKWGQHKFSPLIQPRLVLVDDMIALLEQELVTK